MEGYISSITLTSKYIIHNSHDIHERSKGSSSAQSSVKKSTRRRWQSSVSRASVKLVGAAVIFAFVMCVTVVTTTVGNEHQQRRNLRRHPLFFSHQELTDRTIRYLTLGGPSTGGEGLEVTSNAYPYQLSKLVHNAADSSPYGGSTLASLCTQSIVGDHVYDVVTLEYETYEPESLRLLTKRLRERFPVATIVFVKLWTPLDLYFYDSQTSRKVFFLEWRRQNTSQPIGATKQSLMSDMKDHIWMFDSTEQRDRALEYTMSAVGGRVYRLPVPSDINQELDIVADWFVEIESSKDGDDAHSLRYTLSRRGHSIVAKDLESLLRGVESHAKKRAISASERAPLMTTSLGSVGTPVGAWGSGDSCQIWYETGKGMPRQHSRSLQYREFSNHYALEVTAPGASMSVDNPFDEDRMVFLTYLTTSALAGSKKVYPRTKVHFGNDPSHLILDPSHDDNLDVTHRTRTSAVGIVKAHSTAELQFTPLEEYTLNHFRVVGVSFLAKEKVTHAIPSEFAMSPQGLHIQEEGEDEGDQV